MMASAPYDWSFHTHNRFCDGEGEIGDIIQSASNMGLTDLGISSHAPLPFETDWNMKLESLDTYVEQVLELREQMRGRMRIWLGLELDHIPDESVLAFQNSEILSRPFDYLVVSVHFLGGESETGEFDGSDAGFQTLLSDAYGGDIQAMCGDYYQRIAQAALRPKALIVGHFDLIKRWNAGGRYFDEADGWYREQASAAARQVAESSALVELNTAGWKKGMMQPYPSEWLLKEFHRRGAGVTVSSDSHTPQELTRDYDRAADLLKKLEIEAINPAAMLTNA